MSYDISRGVRATDDSYNEMRGHVTGPLLTWILHLC